MVGSKKKKSQDFFDDADDNNEEVEDTEDVDLDDTDDDDDEDDLDADDVNLADDVDEDDADFKAVAAGTYDAVLDDYNFRKSSSGNPMLEWIFTLDSTDKDIDGRKLYYHTVTNSDRGLAQVKRVVNRLGPDKVDMKKWNHKTSPEALVGARCRLKITVGKYQGRPTNNVREILPAKAQGSEFFDED